MQITTSRPRVSAVLGPTNTGKTHLAMERLLAHESGIIGFPLRLLARENYDRAVAAKGAGQVALITGEEKIVPPGARYFICTVESMPLGRTASFLAIDEIQMCADPDRGHIFTDRLLHARGDQETMVLGAETMKPRLRRLMPEAEFVTRPRFSTLSYSGPRKIARLPRRSAVVAFSAADVYVIAELVRRQRGGAAVVLGALSPRTRNAQVAMYQAGEVDYLVATDAIGMGLNMDVDHVAFAGTRKFDGRGPRPLTASELGQIAGRAGRHMNDGTFGTTADAAPLDAETVDRVENHQFDPLKTLYWRNAALNFTSVAALRASLAEPPPAPDLVRARRADDEVALENLIRDENIAAMATTPDAIRLLWEVCRVPDFRKVMGDAHPRLLGSLYQHLMGDDGRLPTDWVAAQVARIDRTDGDIEAIVQRIAFVRTWTYVAFQSGWMADAEHWRERTRAVEDRLSDALHDRLTQRFVDRRTAVLVSRMKGADDVAAAVGGDGTVLVEGHPVGQLEGFRFVAEPEGDGDAGRFVVNAAARALGGEIAARVKAVETADDSAFTLRPDGQVRWRDEAIARIVRGAHILDPAVEPLTSELLAAAARERVRRRLESWLAGAIATRLPDLARVRQAVLTGAARGLVFQLCEGLGSMPRRLAETQIEGLDRAARQALRRLGIRLGRESVYLPSLLKAAAIETRVLLWAADAGHSPAEVPPGRVSLPVDKNMPRAFYEAVGYRALGPIAVRVDIVERLAAQAWSLARKGSFEAGPDMLSLAGCGPDEMTPVLTGLGYAAEGTGGSDRPVTFRRPRRRPSRERRRKAPGNGDSPFAKLGDLTLPR
jgi:ATP-dependent RNA helicase SUPV3L1/SUV3